MTGTFTGKREKTEEKPAPCRGRGKGRGRHVLGLDRKCLLIRALSVCCFSLFPPAAASQLTAPMMLPRMIYRAVEYPREYPSSHIALVHAELLGENCICHPSARHRDTLSICSEHEGSEAFIHFPFFLRNFQYFTKPMKTDWE